MASQHTAAIHVLRARLGLSEGDYRHVLSELTGKSSCSEMTDAQRAKVRDHLQRQAVRLGVAGKPGRPGRAQPMTPEAFAKAKAETPPKQRKVLALWGALKRARMIEHGDPAALDAWVYRVTQVSALRFCKDHQLDTCIEALKKWLDREPGAPVLAGDCAPGRAKDRSHAHG